MQRWTCVLRSVFNMCVCGRSQSSSCSFEAFHGPAAWVHTYRSHHGKSLSATSAQRRACNTVLHARSSVDGANHGVLENGPGQCHRLENQILIIDHPWQGCSISVNHSPRLPASWPVRTRQRSAAHIQSLYPGVPPTQRNPERVRPRARALLKCVSG